MQVAMGSQDGGGDNYIEGATVQATVPDESQVDVSVHCFWKWGTSAIFDKQIVKFDAGSYRLQTPANALATAEKEQGQVPTDMSGE